MIPELRQFLPYATPAVRPKRFGHFNAIYPFSGGLLVGFVVAYFIMLATPDFAGGSQGMYVIFAFPLYVFLITGYCAVVFLLIGSLSSRTRVPQPATISVLIGIGIPVLSTGAHAVNHVIGVVASPGVVAELIGNWAVWAAIGLMVLGGPFLLVDWPAHVAATDSRRRRARSVLKKTTIGALLVVVLLAIGRWWAEKQYDRDCEELAAWVKANHPAPGIYSALALPASQRLLSIGGTVDAVVLPDGRVIFVLEASSGGRGNWSGILYASGPLTPGEMTTNIYGQSMVGIKGLPEHFIERQIDSQHFVVTFNLG